MSTVSRQRFYTAVRRAQWPSAKTGFDRPDGDYDRFAVTAVIGAAGQYGIMRGEIRRKCGMPDRSVGLALRDLVDASIIERHGMRWVVRQEVK